MRKLCLSMIPVLGLGLVACGGDDDGGGPIDGNPATCTVSTNNFGAKGDLMTAAFFESDPNNAAVYRIAAQGLLEPAEPADIVIVEFYTGYEPFGTEAAPTAVVPGTYQLSGAQLDYATCGVCVRLATNATTTATEDDYMATGGSVTVAAVGDAIGETLTLSFSNVTFQHVTIAPMGGQTTPVGDGCTAGIGSASMSGMVQAFPMAVTSGALTAMPMTHKLAR
jgi:hypothetical protein